MLKRTFLFWDNSDYCGMRIDVPLTSMTPSRAVACAAIKNRWWSSREEYENIENEQDDLTSVDFRYIGEIEYHRWADEKEDVTTHELSVADCEFEERLNEVFPPEPEEEEEPDEEETDNTL